MHQPEVTVSVTPNTAQELVDEIFLFGRALRSAVITSNVDPIPTALVGVLSILATYGECRQSDLAGELCISQSVLSRQIAELVDAGYVCRHSDPADGRVSRIRVTPEGNALLHRSKEAKAALLRATLSHWTEGDALAALDSVRKLERTLFEHAHRARVSNSAIHSGSSL